MRPQTAASSHLRDFFSLGLFFFFCWIFKVYLNNILHPDIATSSFFFFLRRGLICTMLGTQNKLARLISAKILSYISTVNAGSQSLHGAGGVWCWSLFHRPLPPSCWMKVVEKDSDWCIIRWSIYLWLNLQAGIWM